MLGERLSFIGKIGCGLCVLGSTVIVLNAPEQQTVYTMNQLAIKVIDPSMWFYNAAVFDIHCAVFMWKTFLQTPKNMEEPTSLVANTL